MENTKTNTQILIDDERVINSHYRTVLADNNMYADFKNTLNESFMKYLADNPLSSDEHYIIDNFMLVNKVFDCIRIEIINSGNFEKAY